MDQGHDHEVIVSDLDLIPVEDAQGGVEVQSSDPSSTQCTTCGRVFATQSNLNRHRKRIHKEALPGNPSKNGRPRCGCGVCGLDLLNRVPLIKHLRDEHDIHVVTEDLSFKSMNAFQKWKAKIEIETKSDFKKKTDNQYNNISYICTRSGHYNPHGENKRKLKEQGSRKIGAVCPARILMTPCNGGRISVKYTRTHAGHKIDPSHLQLTKELKEWVYQRLVEGIPPSMILKDARIAFPRADLLNRRHIRNIAVLNGIQTTKASVDEEITDKTGKNIRRKRASKAVPPTQVLSVPVMRTRRRKDVTNQSLVQLHPQEESSETVAATTYLLLLDVPTITIQQEGSG